MEYTFKPENPLKNNMVDYIQLQFLRDEVGKEASNHTDRWTERFALSFSLKKVPPYALTACLL